MRDSVANKHLAMAGARNRTSAIVRIRTRTDQCRVTHSTGQLAGRAAGGSGGSEIAIFIQRHGTDSPVLMTVGRTLLRSQKSFQLFASMFGMEIIRTDDLALLRSGELFCAPAHQQNVRRILHHRACGKNGIFDVGDGADGAGTKLTSLHNRRIEFNPTCGVKHGAFAGVEQGRIFEYNDGSHDRVNATGTFQKQSVPSTRSLNEHGTVFFLGKTFFQLAGTAMNDDGDGMIRAHVVD